MITCINVLCLPLKVFLLFGTEELFKMRSWVISGSDSIFLGISSLCKRYTCSLNYCFSPDNVCSMMKQEGSTRHLEGESEIYFPRIYMQRNNTQQWKGMKHQPLKDRDKS